MSEFSTTSPALAAALAAAKAKATATRTVADNLTAAAEEARREDDRGYAFHSTHCGPPGGASAIVKAAQAAAATATAAADRAQEAYDDLLAQAS